MEGKNSRVAQGIPSRLQSADSDQFLEYIHTNLHSRINLYIKKIIQSYFIKEMRLDNFLYAYVFYVSMQDVWIYF